MARCSPLGDVATTNVAEGENVGEAEIMMEVMPPVAVMKCM
jgi:hypothetical protein